MKFGQHMESMKLRYCDVRHKVACIGVGYANFTKSELANRKHSFAFFSTFPDEIRRFSVFYRNAVFGPKLMFGLTIFTAKVAS